MTIYKVYDIALASNGSTDEDILIGTFDEVYEMQDFIENYIREAVADDDYFVDESEAEAYHREHIVVQTFESEV